MSKGKTKSKLSRSERIEKAFEMFERGFNDSDVARTLKVARNTAAAYRTIYQRKSAERADENPRLLQNILGNTMQMLSEIDHIRKAAWKEFEKADKKQRIECPECHEDVVIIFPDADLKNKLLNTALKAQGDRAKLLGTLGVKAEFLGMVAAVKFVQEKLLKFMAENLCAEDRAKLIALLSSPEMAQYMGAAGTMDVEGWEETDHEHAQLTA